MMSRKIMNELQSLRLVQAALLFEIEQQRVCRCSECTHVYLDVAHDAESIRGMYSGMVTVGKASTLPASIKR